MARNDDFGDLLVRSRNSNERCYVRFINTTDKLVDIVWIDFSGRYVRYKMLRKGEFVDVNTFKSHPWMAKDFMTKDTLHIDGKYYYNPRTSLEILREKYPNREIPENYETRVRAHIQLPLYSLRYACLLRLRNHLLNESDADQLGLPRQLSEDLKRAIVKRNRECSLQVLSREF